MQGTDQIPQFNGNISGTIWKSKGDLEKRKYDFSYDAANRILKADFNQYTNNSFNKTAKVDFTSIMGDGINPQTAYDANGNILAMKQWGLQLNSSPVIDQLTYSYHANSNKLKAVNDAIPPQGGTQGGGDFTNKNTSADDYGYDKNGNLITDLNKKLVGNIGIDQITGGAITYNHLNLPQTITAKKDDGVSLKGTIAYTYDAAGNKLKKTVTDNTINPPKVTTTLYISGFEYKNDTLQQVAHEEGRIRSSVAGGLSSYHYDYFIKDHLGNTRMVLTEEQQTDQYPLASMELAQNATESAFYSKVPETRTIKPAGYPADAATNPNAYAAKVNGSGNKIGPGITLKVMAGDKFSIKANSWYKTNGAQPLAATNPLTDLLTALTNGVGNLPGAKSSPLQLQQSAVFTPGATSFLNSQPAQGAKPKAYLNWVLFDEQFNFVANSSGSELVGSDNVFTAHVKSNLPVGKNGYLYVYVSNATPNLDVYFDNLQVTHNRGAILEESHYYPFGLMMAGISSKSAGKLQNEDKTFQGQKFDDDLGVDYYSFKYRNHDAQIGRFIQIDPLASDYVYNSTYAFSENHVTSHIELEGLEKISIKNLTHVSPSNHHTKDLSVIMLNREQVLTNSKSVSFGQKNVVPKGFSDAASWLQSSKTTKASDMNFITSVSETVNTYNSAIVDGESGKLLKTTTTAVTTEVSFSVNDISAINVTTNTSIGYSKITGDDPKNNTLSISLNSSLISTPTSQTTAIPVDKSLSTNVSKLSPGLAPKVTEAAKENNKIYENNKKTIIKNTIH